MKIFSYYQSIALADQAEEFSCANHWKSSWEKNGWECVMLNRSHAQGSTFYNKLSQKLIQISKTLPMELIGRFDWIIARYIRWCALHAAGGGWMSDYDVFNKTFKPDDAESCAKNETLIINNDAPAYIFYATREHAENALKIFIQEPLLDNGTLIDEWKILNFEKNIKKHLKKIAHIHCAKNSIRSKIMEELKST